MQVSVRTTLIGTVALAGASFAAWHWVGAPCCVETTAVNLLTVEQQANVYTYNRQEAPSVDIDSDGNALVVWGSRRQEAGTFGIFGRLFDGTGAMIGGELHLNQEIRNNQETPAVAFSGTDAWVAWQSFGQDGDASSVVARRFGRSGDTFAALSDETVVNETTSGDQLQPAIAAGNDRAMVAWTAETEDGQLVMGRVLNADGTPVGGEFRLGTTDDMIEWIPAVAAQPHGFVATWTIRDRESGAPAGILARRFDTNGNMLGDVIEVTGGADRFDLEPAIDTDREGRIVIAWMATNGTRGYDVLARRFDADGNAVGNEITVAAIDEDGAEEWLSAAAVAMAADGRFVVSWNASMSSEDAGAEQVVARRYDADGTPEAPFTVNRTADGRQTMAVSGARRVAWGEGDRLAFAWDGSTNDDGSGIGVTMMVPEASIASTLTIDDAVLSKATPGSSAGEPVPPTYDPNFVPDPPDIVSLAPGQDFGFIGFQSTGWNPPDPDIAVGPNGVLVCVNGGVRYFDKQGTQQWTRSLTGGGGFWGGQGGGGFVFDPVALFDPHTNRFVVLCTEHDGNTDYLTIGVSNDDDPSGGTGYNDFIKRRWNVNNICGFIDFPNLGVDEDAIYVTTDCFNSPGGNKAWIIDKADLLAGNDAFPDFVQMSGGFFSLGAVKNYDTNVPAQYFVTAEHGSSNSVQMKGISDPLGSANVSTVNVTVPSYSSPPGAEQLGSTSRLATVGKRIKNGVYRNGRLWITHTVGQNNTARMRWYEFDMMGWPTSGNNPTLVQGGTYNLGGGVHNWFGDVDVDASGNAAFAFNRSSSNEFVGVWRTFRMATDAPGALRDPVQMQSSTAPDTSGRWGDYGGIHQDPANPAAFWNMHEYRSSSWRTWVGMFELPVVASCPADVDMSGEVDIVDLLAVLGAWGNAGGAEDIDGSGSVDFGDIVAVLKAWGACP